MRHTFLIYSCIDFVFESLIEIVSRNKASIHSDISLRPLNTIDNGIVICNSTHTLVTLRDQHATYSYGVNAIDFRRYLPYISNPTNASLAKKHKTLVVVRTYKGHAISLVRLVRGLLQQSSYIEGLHIVIVCTEYESYKIIADSILHASKTFTLAVARRKRDFTIDVLNVSRQLFTDPVLNPQVARLKLVCEPLQLQVLAYKWRIKQHEVDYSCKIDNPIHYFLTDLAMLFGMTACPTCEYLLITNGDNYYYGAFLSTALQYLAPPSHKYDLTLNDWNHRGVIKSVSASLGNVDLGSAVFRIDALKRVNRTSLTNALPGCADARDYYSADGHFIETLTRKDKLRHVLLHNALFDHN